MIKNLSGLYRQYKKRVTSSVKKQQETEQAKTKAQREAEKATARRKEAANLKAAASSEAANTAQQQTQQAQQKAERFNHRFRAIFSRKFGLGDTPTDQQIINKISSLGDSIKGDCGTDFIKENPNTVNMMNELLEDPQQVSGGGSKLKLNQKGGNQKWLAAEKCNTDYTNLYGTLEEFMQAPRSGEAYISGINEIIGLFSSMTLDYVEENDTQTDKLINEVLDKTVEKEKVEYGDIEFNLADEREELLKAIEYQKALISRLSESGQDVPQYLWDEIEYLNKIFTDNDGDMPGLGDAMIKKAFNRRENDSNCDTEKTVEKYSAELDPEGVQIQKNVKEGIKDIRDLLSPLRQTDIRDLGVATPRTKARREADKSVPRFDFDYENWNSNPPYCLLCTKGNNTRALNSDKNTLYSISKHYPETQNRIHHLVYKGQQVQGDPRAKFCPYCKKIMEKKIDSVNHDDDQVYNYLRFLAKWFPKKMRLRQDLEAQLTTRYRRGSLDEHGFTSGASSSNMEDTRKKDSVVQVDKKEKLKVLNTKVREIKAWLRGFRVGQRVGFLPQFTSRSSSNNGTIMIINKDHVFITPDGFPRGRGITIYFTQMMTNWPDKLFWICAVQSAGPVLPHIGTNAQFIPRRPPCKRSSSTGASKESPFGDKDKSKRKSGKREGGGKRSKKKTKRRRKKKKRTKRKNKRKNKTKRRRKKKKKTRRRR